MPMPVSTLATIETTTGRHVPSDGSLSSTIGPPVGNSSTLVESTGATVQMGTTTVDTTSSVTTNMTSHVTTVVSNATTGASASEATNATDTNFANATTTPMAMLNITTLEMTVNTTTTILNGTTTALPTTLSGNASTAANDTRIGSTTPATTPVTSNQTLSTFSARHSTVTSRTSTHRTTVSPTTMTKYTTAQTTWSIPSRVPGSTTASPQLFTGKNIYIGAGAVAAGVMLVIILASIFCSRRRKHSKCRKLPDDGHNVNAYEVEMANRLGADNIGAMLVDSEGPDDGKPEIRNYFQDGLSSEENNSSADEVETPDVRAAAPPSGIKIEDRLSVGPVMLSGSSGSTQETYDRAYSTHDTFKNW